MSGIESVAEDGRMVSHVDVNPVEETKYFQQELNLYPRLPRNDVLDYYHAIEELMKQEKIPVSYSGFNEKTGRGIFEFHRYENLFPNVRVYMLFEDKTASMVVDGDWNKDLEAKIKKIVPINECGVVQAS